MAKERRENEIEVKSARDERGNLTHAGMEAVIAAGGSVLHNGKVVTDLGNLPSEVDMARGDAEREKQLAAALDDQIARLQQQKAMLKQPEPKKEK